MTDTRATGEDRLPWLEAVDEEDREEGPGAAKLIAFVVIGLVAIGLIVGGLFWMTNRGAVGTEAVPEGGELIAAPAEEYKVKPEQPGGMNVQAKGDTSALAASAGAEPKGRINMDAVPEAPVATRPQQQAAVQPKAPPAPRATPAPRPTRVAIAQPKATPAPVRTPAPASTSAPAAVAAAGGSGAAIQLGAFSSQASANNAWKNLSSRFRYLQPLTQNVVAVQSGGKTLYRLRASGPDARSICGRLRVAGESCVQVN